MTLIELLVAVALMTMILASVAYIFSHARRVISISKAKVTIQQQARIILDILERDLQGAVLVWDGAGTAAYFTYPVDGGGDDLARLAANQTVELRFVSVAPGRDPAIADSASDTRSNLFEILYYHDPATKILYRKVSAAPVTFAGAGLSTPSAGGDREPDELGTDLTRFILRFNGETGDPDAQWDVPALGAVLPRRITVMLEFQDSLKRQTERFTKDLWIPGG